MFFNDMHKISTIIIVVSLSMMIFFVFATNNSTMTSIFQLLAAVGFAMQINFRRSAKYWSAGFAIGAVDDFFIEPISSILSIASIVLLFKALVMDFTRKDDDDDGKEYTKEAEEKENKWRHTVLKPILGEVRSK